MNIYLDMDGVLANFIDGTIKSLGIDKTHNATHDGWAHWGAFEKFGVTKERWDEWFSKISEDAQWWQDLEPYEDLEGIVEVVKHFDPGFQLLTHSPSHPATTGKLMFRRNIDCLRGVSMISEEVKEKYCSPGDVLIDDKPENCMAWKDKGGISLLWDRPWNQDASPEGHTFRCFHVNDLEMSLKWINEGMFDDPPMIEDSTWKDTNPKDACGIAKAPISTVSMPVMLEVGLAMMEGARKYGRHNYRVSGVRASVYHDATFRHMAAWWEGEDLDPDSGISHVTKAIASLTVLRDAMLNDMLKDDRPPKAAPFMPDLNEKAKEILSKYPESVSSHTAIPPNGGNFPS